MPTDFPLLLVVPALALDLVMQRLHGTTERLGAGGARLGRLRRGVPRGAVAVRRLPDDAGGAQRVLRQPSDAYSVDPAFQARWYVLRPSGQPRGRPADRGAARRCVGAVRPVVGKLDGASPAMNGWRVRCAVLCSRRRRWRTSAAPTHSLSARRDPTRPRQRPVAWRDPRPRAGRGSRRRRREARRITMSRFGRGSGTSD